MEPRASDWARTTAAITAADLDDGSRGLIRETAYLHGREEDPLAGGAEGIRTLSEPAKKGRVFRRGPQANEVSALLAPPFLVLVAAEFGGRPHATIYPLDGIEVAEFTSPLITDTGLDITGHPLGGTGERPVRFLPLDQGPAGRRFREALERAVAAA
jgi:hypothetical protein